MGPTACGLVAGLIDGIEGPRSDQGRPRCPTQAVVETLLDEKAPEAAGS